MTELHQRLIWPHKFCKIWITQKILAIHALRKCTDPSKSYPLTSSPQKSLVLCNVYDVIAELCLLILVQILISSYVGMQWVGKELPMASQPAYGPGRIPVYPYSHEKAWCPKGGGTMVLPNYAPCSKPTALPQRCKVLWIQPPSPSALFQTTGHVPRKHILVHSW